MIKCTSPKIYQQLTNLSTGVLEAVLASLFCERSIAIPSPMLTQPTEPSFMEKIQ